MAMDGCLLFGLFTTLLIFGNCLGNLRKSCSDSCSNTYEEKALSNSSALNSSCQRGCRLFSIMEATKKESREMTQKACIIDCAEAYTNTDEWRACRIGCEYQLLKQKPADDTNDMTVEFLYPMLQMHRLYSSMFDEMWQQLHVQWSYFLQKGDGQVVIVKSQPQFVVAFAEVEFSNDKTPVNPETNIQTVDLSATPNVRHSQVRSLEGVDTPYLQADPQTHYTNWLDCMAKKTGMPHILIVAIVVLCVIIMVWLCFTATSSRSSSQSEKLSINGDLQFLKDAGMESLMSYESPHERIHGNKASKQANKLPLKIAIQDV